MNLSIDFVLYGLVKNGYVLLSISLIPMGSNNSTLVFQISRDEKLSNVVSG